MVTQIFLIPNHIPPPVLPILYFVFPHFRGDFEGSVVIWEMGVFFPSLSLLGSENLSGFGALFGLLALFLESFAGEIRISLCVAHFVFNFLTF
jgi:hypothetical protein